MVEENKPVPGASGGAAGNGDAVSDDKIQEAFERRKRRLFEERSGLNVTSLMDAITIILFFIMIQSTTDPLNISLNARMQLATSTAEVRPSDDSIAIMITKRNIVLDNKSIVQINCSLDKAECTDQDFEQRNLCEKKPSDAICSKEFKFEVDKQDKEKGDPNSLVIEPLRKELDRIVKQQIAEDEALGRKFKGVVTLIADREIPFRILMEVIYTAGKIGVQGKGGLSQFRFAIMKGGNE
jgi:biopolymer transport protein ExbD